eukprot:TRINITY_DN6179_c0_g1_i14.p1 TRINITY_DN6179_c0_g1~~TRINITY_DN6179_c0_g1_i14.p1  ORF type:complete len:532 (-),score=102.56 TRINITY_DN6179_c0_g1_i14:101-1621(-)
MAPVWLLYGQPDDVARVAQQLRCEDEGARRAIGAAAGLHHEWRGLSTQPVGPTRTTTCADKVSPPREGARSWRSGKRPFRRHRGVFWRPCVWAADHVVGGYRAGHSHFVVNCQDLEEDRKQNVGREAGGSSNDGAMPDTCAALQVSDAACSEYASSKDGSDTQPREEEIDEMMHRTGDHHDAVNSERGAQVTLREADFAEDSDDEAQERLREDEQGIVRKDIDVACGRVEAPVALFVQAGVADGGTLPGSGEEPVIDVQEPKAAAGAPRTHDCVYALASVGQAGEAVGDSRLVLGSGGEAVDDEQESKAAADITYRANSVVDDMSFLSQGEWNIRAQRAWNAKSADDEDVEALFNLVSRTNAKQLRRPSCLRASSRDEMMRLCCEVRRCFDERIDTAVAVLRTVEPKDSRTWDRMSRDSKHKFEDFFDQVEKDAMVCYPAPAKAKPKPKKQMGRLRFKGVSQRHSLRRRKTPVVRESIRSSGEDCLGVLEIFVFLLLRRVCLMLMQ